MNNEEAKALTKGDIVHVNCGVVWGHNAITDGHDCRIEPRTVVRVNAKTVATNAGSYRPDQLISPADADAAKAAFAERKRKLDAERERILAAIAKVKGIPGFSIQTYSGLTISASGVDDIERLAALIVTAHRGRELADAIGRAMPVEDGPVVTLHLSVAQAQRVLAALGGVP